MTELNLDRLILQATLPNAISRRQWLRAAGLSWGLASSHSRRRLLPSNEAETNASLLQLLDEMRGSVGRRDAGALTFLMDRVFRVEFDGGQGPLAFQRFWKPEDPAAELWELMSRLLRIGGTFYSPTLFGIPYVYTRFPIDLDPLSHVVALGKNVAVRSQPNAEAPTVCFLEFDIVATSEELKPPVLLPRRQWVKVVTPNGPEGYVASAELWCPAAHRMFFENRGGKWRWISLVCATSARPGPGQKRIA